jgi:hypothetical protein
VFVEECLMMQNRTESADTPIPPAPTGSESSTSPKPQEPVAEEHVPTSPAPGARFVLASGELLFLFVAGSSGVSLVAPEPLQGSEVRASLRTRHGEPVAVAAYSDVSALLGREPPTVWAIDASGQLVRVLEFHRAAKKEGP